jgi:hypothetical protein
MINITSTALERVIDLLRCEPRWANASRHEIEVYLGDFERDLQEDVDDFERELAAEIEAWAEYDRERDAEIAACQQKQQRKQCKQRGAAA